MTFPLIFPLTFASSIFVPVYEDAVVAARFRQQPAGERDRPRGARSDARHAPRPLHLDALAWALGAILVLAPLSTARYRKVA